MKNNALSFILSVLVFYDYRYIRFIYFVSRFAYRLVSALKCKPDAKFNTLFFKRMSRHPMSCGRTAAKTVYENRSLSAAGAAIRRRQKRRASTRKNTRTPKSSSLPMTISRTRNSLPASGMFP